MRKILYFQHSSANGGAPRSLKLLIDRLDRTLWEPTVVFPFEGPMTDEYRGDGINVIIEQSIRPYHGSEVTGMSLKTFAKNNLEFIPTIRRAKKIIREIEPDLIHLNSTCLFPVGFANNLLAGKGHKRIPVVTHVREPLLNNIFGGILAFGANRTTDAFVAISAHDLASVSVKDDKTSVVVPNYIEFTDKTLDQPITDYRNMHKIGEKDRVLTYLARVVDFNGALEFVKTFSKHSQSNPHLHVIIAGFYDKLSPYEEQVKTYIDACDQLHLQTFTKDIYGLIRSSDYIVAPFLTPHFSRAIVEGIALGKPSIITNVDSLNELVVANKTGFIYNNEEELRQILERIAKGHDDFSQLSEQAQAFSKTKFDSAKNSKQIFDLYEQLMTN